jgi:putative ABC transport system permease protein
MTFFKLAWRNVFRNARRSLLTVAAIAVGLTALSFLWSFIEGVNDQMVENSTRYLTGHVQVHRSGFHDNQTLDLIMDDARPVHFALAGQPHVVAASERLEGMAIASLGDKSRAIMVIGIDPQQEKQVTTLYQTIVSGAYLTTESARDILLGDKTAQTLGAQVGSEVVLVTQGADGSVGAGKYTVRGIFDAKMDMIDGGVVFVPLKAAQELYSAGRGVTAMVAKLDDRRYAQTLAESTSARLGGDFEVLEWQKILPMVVQSTKFHGVIAYILLFVLFVVVAVGVTNTILMGVMERYREFGVMMALGTRGSQITTVVFAEACLLGLLGLLIGAVLGAALTLYLGSVGINLGNYAKAMETMQGLTGIVYPKFLPERMALLGAIVFCTAIVAALYPSWKASRLNPVDALKGVVGQARNAGRWRSRLPAFSLPLFATIAARGLARNPRRAILTASAAAFGLAAFVFLLSFVQGYLSQLVENSTGYITGDLQIQHDRFRDDMAPEFALSAQTEILNKVRSQPGVVAAAPRVQAQVLITSPVKSQIVTLVGIDPLIESQVTFIDRTVKDGRWLGIGSDREVIIGRKLATNLSIRLGEKLVVMTQALDGSLASSAYRVAGVYETESPSFDSAFAYVTLSSAQSLLGLRDRASTIAVRLKDRERTADIATTLTAKINSPGISAQPWQKLVPEVAQMIDYVRVNLRLVVAIVFSVVAIGVMNTLLMSVMERIREFGIMMALGTRPGQIVRVVVYEAIVLTFIGLVVGYIAGAMIVSYFASAGIDMSRYAAGISAIPGLTGLIYPQLATQSVVLPAVTLFLLSLVATLYPAWKAARLEPVEAIRHV